MTAAVGPEFMDMWRPASDPDFPWTGILFGAPILGIWYWCTDQFIVQRTLSARTIDDARRGTIFAGFLKLLPLFIFVLPGLIATTLVRQGKMTLADTNEALPALVAALLPVGLRGLVVAGLLAALMSSLSGVFNSCSTLITWDVYKKLHPAASETRLVWVGRLSTVALTVLGLAWIPFVESADGGLYVYIQSVQAYISPPIAAVFLLGLFSSRLNARGAMASLLTGLVLGLGRLVCEATGVDARRVYTGLNFLMFAVALFLVCSVVLVGVSLATAPPPEEKTDGLTFGTADRAAHGGADVPAAALASSASWRNTDRALSAVLVVCVAAVWLIFS